MNSFRFHQCLYRIIDTPKWLNLRKSILNKKQNGYDIQAWWRDDDICENTNELDSLIRFVESNNIPAFLSVIPDKLTQSTISKLKIYKNIFVLQHGYSHINYAPLAEPYNEFGNHRNIQIQMDEIKIGFNQLLDQFGDQFIPVFVPPWGNISTEVKQILLEIGFKGISQIGKVNNPVKGLKDLNSNIDIHNWQSTSELLYTTEVRSWKNIIDAINKKINSQINEKEIRIGLLTHSQIMCKSDWKYFQRIVHYLRSSGTEFINASALIN